MKKMEKTILVIDDQQSTRKLLNHYLSKYYNVVAKEGAKHAIEWLHQGNRPDVIIADLIMPDVSGIEFLRGINGTLKDKPPILILSSVENVNEKINCFKLGVRDYLLKPFNPDELRLRIENLINN